MLNLEDLRKLSAKDLNAELVKVNMDLAHRKLHVRLGEDKQNHLIKAMKKYIAQIKTLAKVTALASITKKTT